MASKVQEMLSLVEDVPGLEALIFSGTTPGLVEQALLGAHPGTRIVAGFGPA
jgi:isopentenyl phosphate kinase